MIKERLLADFETSLDHSGVSGERLAQRLAEIASIGYTEDGGSRRIGFSQEEKHAKQLVAQWMKDAGLEVREDGAGNIFGRCTGTVLTLPAIMSGSHLDSVPNGGHFDGPLGVIAALEVVEAWRTNGYKPARTFEVVVFSDEEGARFNGGLLGSQAMMGQVNRDEITRLVDIEGQPFSDVIRTYGLNEDEFFNSQRDMSEIATFIEVHIEQGKRLEKENLPVGIVTGIAGPCWMEVTFKGAAGHAGNTPMNDRQDALLAASKFVVALNSLPHKVSPTAVATVGKLDVSPNGANVIAGEVKLIVDIRDIHTNSRDALVELAIEELKKIDDVTVTWEEKIRIEPVPVQDDMLDKLTSSVKANNITPYYLPSGAGHDAMIVGAKIPIAMLFVKSKEGISHNPKEWTMLNDCVHAVHVLKHFVENY
ncbi:Zn-dependent hydrolase [Bacillus sp. HMF5848]|uniref:M20 family metallo-hydrolase n=1 Tax=Bacillus sp. HMF5848 TaxID=2495421 RepID=UPI000F7AEB81|nr:M20 family metallo-hydrolase [Bacillus sp. HMF5848]RSK23934.1 Zn-dependent hydrolase [Bacillus sp. HMF5848]RSK28749.1 Zn-dependent hydrolase [Bacillus sp. HMF5848]